MTPNTIIHGDALTELRKLPDECVDCIITSPPYWGLRDYGVAGQLGLEESPEEYVARMVEVFREVRRVLRNDGTLWLNIGDSYAATRKGGPQGKNGARADRRFVASVSAKMGDGLKNKDLVGIPWMLAFALRADGWYLRQDIIWSKPNPMPESVTDRCTKAHEYIFLVTKSQKYYFDNKAVQELAVYGGVEERLARQKDDMKSSPTAKKNGIRRRVSFAEPLAEATVNRGKSGKWESAPNAKLSKGVIGMTPDSFNKAVKTMLEKGTRNRRSVWTVNTAPFKEAHFATFPEKLIEPMVLAGTPPKGIVLDPFMGAGTTALVAKKLGRQYIGIELNPEYIKMAEKRLRNIPNPLF